MNLEELKKRKKERGYTYIQMSQLSGVPQGTLQKIFSGETVNPRYDTMIALESLLDETDDMSIHQLICGEVYRQIANFLMEWEGRGISFVAPLDVQLDCNEKTTVQPDVMILCDKDKIKRGRIIGAPDFILEVTSFFAGKEDYAIKANKYMDAGVREYWIVNPYQKQLTVYNFNKRHFPMACGLDEPVPIGIYHGALKISFDYINQWIAQYC